MRATGELGGGEKCLPTGVTSRRVKLDGQQGVSDRLLLREGVGDVRD